MKDHNCRMADINGRLIWICSRCGKCYRCQHIAIYMEEQGIWMWKRKDGKGFEPVIHDARLTEIPADQR